VTLAAQSVPPSFSLRVHGSGSDALAITTASAVPGGTVATLFAIGELAGTPKPLQVLVCAGDAAPNGALAACAALP
jgi:hypothetical protein